MAKLFGGSLTDPRVRIRETDVGDLIRAARSEYDAILLDVDNGPDGITRESNDRLYDLGGLAAAYRALRPGGVLAVWSSAPDAKFTARLRKTGFAVVENPVRAKGPQGGAQHFIWTATRGDESLASPHGVSFAFGQALISMQLGEMRRIRFSHHGSNMLAPGHSKESNSWSGSSASIPKSRILGPAFGAVWFLN